MKKIIFVLTNVNDLGTTGKKTGFYLPEVSHPYSVLKNEFEIEFASINGGMCYPEGIDDLENDLVSKDFYANSKELFTNTKKLNTLKYSDYDAIFFAGGHGTMWDFPNNEDIQNAIVNIYENDGVVSSVCHGPAALVNVKLSNGKYLLEGKNFTSFSNDEEESISFTDIVPFLVETSLVKNGGIFEKAPLWEEKVVVDSNIVTGQNPASSYKVAEKIKEILL